MGDARDGAAALDAAAVFRLRGSDEAGDRPIAVVPARIAARLRARQHQPAQQFGDGVGIDAAPDIARGQGAQFDVEVLAGDDAADEFGVLAQLLAGLDRAAAGRGRGGPSQILSNSSRAVDRLALDDLDAVGWFAADRAEKVGLRQGPAFAREDAAIRAVEAAHQRPPPVGCKCRARPGT